MVHDTVPKPSRRSASRPTARIAALAAVAAATLVSPDAKADAGLNMNLAYDYFDGASNQPGVAVTPQAIGEGTDVQDPYDRGIGASLGDASPDAFAIDEAVAVMPPAARATGTADQALAEAEQHYLGGRYKEALPLFRAIVAANPADAHAWLRIGNLMHRKRDWFDALSAYRRASRPDADPVIREKAIYNVALLNLELARQSLKRLERLRAESGAGERSEAAALHGDLGDEAVRRLSDRIGTTYETLADARRAPAPAPGPTPEAPIARSVAPAPRAGPRTPRPSAAEKPQQVEIRQGGMSR